jgi:Flp pilus assembly pilin Flp
MLKHIRNVLRDNKGIAPLEYALIAGLMFSAILNASAAFAPKLTSSFKNIGATLVARDAGT